jgi:hypothetical protein
MSIAACGESLTSLLTAKLREGGGLSGFIVDLMSPSDAKPDLEGRIGLILYRVELDGTRRRLPLPRRPPDFRERSAMPLELRFLLAVWGRASAAGEHVMLGRCMEILDEYAVLSGPLLSEAYTWEPGQAIQVSVDTLSTDELARLWDGMGGTLRLSVPYLVRTARLGPVERREPAMVDTRTLVFADGVPS